MDGAAWRKLQDLFLQARELPPEPRELFLSQLGRTDPVLAERIRALVAVDCEPGLLDVPAPLPPMSSVLASPAPERIGPYRVVSEIGRGGMGVVYLAERADGQFDHRVAIKLVDSGDADSPTYRRFLAERQILAGLAHPGIARLLDGGLTDDGRPFLVMEYVDGLPITAWCDRHALDVRARLRLFADVCAAVQHAHGSLVVHRDLKPGNILVSSDGRVHLLDFGIAKLLAPSPSGAATQETRVGLRAMTPEYASPEQVRGQVLTTASDIYALGVLLYKLLTGVGPYRLDTGSPIEIAAAVCEQEPTPPSVRVRRHAQEELGERPGGKPSGGAPQGSGASGDRLARQLRGDLDAIVSMALRKEPDRRYASADRLRDDVERYLADRPVVARRDSRRYRAEKFVRRHRLEVGTSLVTVVALLAGLGAAVREGRRANVERERAEAALAESESVTRFLLDLYRTGEPGEPLQAELSAVDLLRRGATRAEELAGQPTVHARLLDAVGQLSLFLGRIDDAKRQLERAVEVWRAAPDAGSGDLASSLIHLAWVHRARPDYATARSLVAEALAIRRRELPNAHPDVAAALYELGWLHFGAEQERLYREALASVETADAPELVVSLLQGLSTNLRRQGRLPEAVAADREALAAAESSFGPEHPTAGSAMIHLADQVRDIEQDLDGAERLYRRGLEIVTAAYGETDPRLVHGLNSLAALLGQRDDDEAERLLRRALAIRTSATGPEHPLVADELALLAEELVRQLRFDEAEALARQALSLTTKTVGADHPTVSNARLPLLARVLEAQGRHDEADRTYRRALETTPSRGAVPGQMHRAYGLILLGRGDLVRSEEQLLRSLSELEWAYEGRDHPNVQETKRALMRLYGAWNKQDLVERYRVPPGRFVPY